MTTAGLLRSATSAYATGVAGTAAMTATTWLQRQVRRTRDVPVDYDATGHVVTAVSKVLRHRPSDDRQATELFLLAHWGYGSAVATGHHALLTRLSRPQAAACFFVGCQTMAFVLFPVLGETPAPWRWRRDVLVSSLAQHLVYVGTVSLTDLALARRSAPAAVPQASA